MAAMDDTDRQIIEALRADGRMSMRALADLVHISRANAYARVSRLEREGVITGYAALIDPVRAGTRCRPTSTWTSPSARGSRCAASC